MRNLVIIIGLIISLCQGCYVHVPRDQLKDVIKTPLKYLPKDQLPEQWLWNDVNGTNYLTLLRNQHIPQYCGSCWSFATTSALADRIKILRKAQWPDIELAPQILLSCSHGDNKGCSGGNHHLAYEYIHNFSICHESCSNYQANGWDTGLDCSNLLKCQECDSAGNCSVPDSYPIYTVDEYASIDGEEAMMNEIYQRGPIACSLDDTPLFNYTGGIINWTGQSNGTNHVVSIVGYGVENDVPYWLVRNSWGSYYGEYGFFRILRGSNNALIESHCSWGTPKDTWTNNVRNHTNNTEKVKMFYKEEQEKGFLENKNRISLNPSSLPGSWDWRNVSGRNYLSWTRNQNSPQYCNSGWAQAATSALADRINIFNNVTNQDISLSVQAMINCNAGGSCDGGDPIGVYQYALLHGIPEDTCQNYLAANPAQADCAAIKVCQNCMPGKNRYDCFSVPEYKNWTVSKYGTVVGVQSIKKAIYEQGPVSCGIVMTPEFEAYIGGVFQQATANLGDMNHYVSLVGWGIDSKTQNEYWIGRNSFGNAWGEFGFFRILIGRNNLNIENYCTFGIPNVTTGKKETTKIISL